MPAGRTGLACVTLRELDGVRTSSHAGHVVFAPDAWVEEREMLDWFAGGAGGATVVHFATAIFRSGSVVSDRVAIMLASKTFVVACLFFQIDLYFGFPSFLPLHFAIFLLILPMK